MATIFAYELTTGDRITVNGSELVTVAHVTRRDSASVTNGVVYFKATNGRTFGVDRYARGERIEREEDYVRACDAQHAASTRLEGEL